MPLDLITKLLLERQMSSHAKPDPMAPGMDIGIATPRTEDGTDYTVGGFNSMLAREQQRKGLPGTTPYVDPRLIDPMNNPLMSLESLKRGDIRLMGPKSPLVGPHGVIDEDYTNLANMLRLQGLIK